MTRNVQVIMDNRRQRLRTKYIWYGISQDCNNYVKSCKECSTSKKPHLQPKAPLGQYHAGIPMERIHIDILGPFIESARGNRYIVIYEVARVLCHPKSGSRTSSYVSS